MTRGSVTDSDYARNTIGRRLFTKRHPFNRFRCSGHCPGTDRSATADKNGGREAAALKVLFENVVLTRAHGL